jgi:ribosomal protein S7
MPAKSTINYSNLINSFSNYLVKNGKKKKIIKFFLKIFLEKISSKYKYRHFFLLAFIILKIRPSMELKTIKKGSESYFFPAPFKKYKSFKLALLWISKSIKSRRENSLPHKIKKELDLILESRGDSWNQHLLFQKKISANILYSHYRWR